MRKVLLLILFSAIAQASNFIEVKVHDLNIEDQLDPNGYMGKLSYNSALISTQTLSFNLQDRNKRKTETDVYFLNKQLKLDNGMLTAQFDMSDNDFFGPLQLLKLNSAESVIAPNFFNISGGHFEMLRDGIELHANNFFVFCTVNDPEYDMASGSGIVKGCLTELVVTPKSNEEPVDYVFSKKLDINSTMTIKGDIGKLNLKESRLLSMTSPISFINYKQYEVEATDIDLSCEKDVNSHELETDTLISKCENTVKVNIPRILVKNSVDKTNFYFDIDKLDVQNERIIFDSNVFQFLDTLKSVTVKDLVVDCKKDESSNLFDIPSMMNECLVDSKITINKLKTTEDGKKPRYNRYGRQVSRQVTSTRYKDSELNNYEPLSNLSLDKSDLSGIDITIKNGKAKIKALAYKNILIKKNFEIDMTANVTFNKENSQMVLDVEDVVVPFGILKIKWVWLIEQIIKKAVVGSVVKYDAGKFFITI